MIKKDHCVYIKRSIDKFVILSLYVDEILIAGNNEYIIEIKGWLSSKFEMKDMGEVAYIHGVKIQGINQRNWCLFHKINTSRKSLSDFKCRIVSSLILLWRKVRF